jgi:uroporphyrinogen-III synthase
LEERGIRVSLVPSEFVAEGIVRALRGWYTQEAGLQGKQILLPQARVARDPIKRELEALGATVEIVPCYENVAPDPDPSLLESLDRFTPELMVFTSTSAVKHFFALVGEARARSLLEEAVVAALGPITQRALTERGLGVEILPAENTAASLLQAIAAHFQPQSH